MTTYKITPLSNCPYCHGTGEVTDRHPYGSTYVTEYLICDCVLEQLPEEYNDSQDDFEIDLSNLPDGGLNDDEFVSWDDDPGYF